jgi:hypothetical protein
LQLRLTRRAALASLCLCGLPCSAAAASHVCRVRASPSSPARVRCRAQRRHRHPAAPLVPTTDARCWAAMARDGVIPILLGAWLVCCGGPRARVRVKQARAAQRRVGQRLLSWVAPGRELDFYRTRCSATHWGWSTPRSWQRTPCPRAWPALTSTRHAGGAVALTGTPGGPTQQLQSRWWCDASRPGPRRAPIARGRAHTRHATFGHAM